VSGNASSLYARNLYAFIEPMIDKKDSALKIDWNDDIIKGTALTRDGQIIHPSLTGAKA
jgi:NAD(P) transhydrogenase subunit alpha